MEATPAAWLRMPARADRRAGLRLKPQLPPLQDDHFVIVTFFATPNVV